MSKFKSRWLFVSASILAMAACAPKTLDYSICDDTNVTNNNCPDVTSNVTIVDDVNGME